MIHPLFRCRLVMGRGISFSTPTDDGAIHSRRRAPTSSCSTTTPRMGDSPHGRLFPACRLDLPAAISAQRFWFLPTDDSFMPATDSMTALQFSQLANGES